MKQKLLASILIVAMLFSLVPTAAMAETSAPPAPVIKSSYADSVVLEPGAGTDTTKTMEYKATRLLGQEYVTTHEWQTDTTFKNLAYGVEYYFFARYSDNETISGPTEPYIPKITVELDAQEGAIRVSTSGALKQTMDKADEFVSVEFTAGEGYHFNDSWSESFNVACFDYTISNDKKTLTINGFKQVNEEPTYPNSVIKVYAWGNEPVKIAIETLPTKLNYTVGETFDINGLVVNAMYLSQASQALNINDLEFYLDSKDVLMNLTDPLTFGSHNVYVSYKYVRESDSAFVAWQTKPITITVKNPATISFKDTYAPSKLYDGVDISNPTADDLIITGAGYNDVVFTWTDDDGNPVTDTPVNSGSYTLTATIPETSDRVEASAKLVDIVIAYGYDITVTNGISSAAKAAEGTTITITANAPTEGMKFKAWNTTPSALTFVNGTSTTSSIAEFTMPVSAVEVKAIYEAITNDDGNEGDNDTPVTPPDDEDDDSNTPPSGDDEENNNTPSSGDDEDDTTTPSASGSSGFSGSYNYPVTIPTADNGSAVLSDSNAVAGESVTITTKPDEGYGAAEVIVTDEDGNIIPVTDLGNGQYAFTMPEGEVTIEVVYKPAITMVIDSVYINIFGKTIKNDVAPMIVGDRTMLPIRVVAEALGADVDWDAETQKVTITKGDTVIELFIGEATAYVNGEPVQLDAAPFIENDRTYLPVRFVSEYLGAVVYWDADTRTVTVIPE